MQVTKNLVDPDGVVADGRTFPMTWSCVYGSDPAVTGTFAPAAGGTWTAPADSILLGSVCTVTEQPSALQDAPSADDPSYVWTGLPSAQTVSVTADPSPPPRTALPEQLVLAENRYGK